MNKSSDPETTVDHFPTTRIPWDKGPAEIRRHVMEVYAYPLQVYCQKPVWRWGLGDAVDFVNGFFLSRLSRPKFLESWQRSRRRLREWLKTAMSYYIKEQRRAKSRGRGESLPEEGPDAEEEDWGRAHDRAFAVSIVRRALSAAKARCAAEKREHFWRLFYRRHYQGVPLLKAAAEEGVDPDRASVMVRTASKRFREALADLLLDDGVSRDRLADEVNLLLEILRS